MTRPVDPALARNLADRIERLPDLINDPLRMPFVHDTLRAALKQHRSDRETQALGREIIGDPGKADEYSKPVAFVQLLDAEKQVIEECFKHDETGVFEEIERDAAEIGEWLKEYRHPRDAERFRESLKFACSDMVVWPVLGVEIRPGVYKLDLSIWEAEVAKPLCNYLRRFADEMATGGNPPDPPKLEPVGPVPDDGFRYKGKVYRGLAAYPWLFLNAVWSAKDQAMRYEDLAEPVYTDAEKYVTYSAVNGWQRGVNGFFQEHALPFQMSASEKTRIAKLVQRPEEISENF